MDVTFFLYCTKVNMFLIRTKPLCACYYFPYSTKVKFTRVHDPHNGHYLIIAVSEIVTFEI
jgi:hypothetical protein